MVEKVIKEQTKALWKRCFEDSDAFVEMYFRLRYKPTENFVISNEDGEVISALQAIPYPMTFCGDIIQTAYISGACTHPDFRDRGAMRQLLTQAFGQMLREGVHVSTLIPAEPWLFGYYARLGYAPVFGREEEEVKIPEQPADEDEGWSVEKPSGQPSTETYAFLNRKLSERPCCIQHTAEDFQIILADLAVSGGAMFVARHKGNVCGIAIIYIYKVEERIVIKELCADNDKAEQHLLQAIGRLAGERPVTRLRPPRKGKPCQPMGMARIINAQEILQRYAVAFPEEEMQIELADSQLPANNGCYYLHKGECTHYGKREMSPDNRISISELTERIFYRLHPYMSLMLD